MKTVAIILLIVGGILGIHALTMDVSVKVNYSGGSSFGLPDRVNNLGLINERQNYLIGAGILLICGFIGLVFGKNSPKKTIEYKHKEFEEQAKRAEFKGQTKEALDLYLDALYHLENDYPNLKKTNEGARLKKVAELKAKIEELKQHQNS